MSVNEHRVSFFRQSGWMMVTTVGSGVLMSLVHVFSKFIPDTEYSAFGTLLQISNWMIIPAIGLQATIAQQTSAILTEEDRASTVATVKGVIRGTFYIWVLMVLAAVAFHSQLIAALKISNPVSLWLTLFMGLSLLWLPIFQGLLQGRQNFLWLGWAAVFNGFGRLFIAGFIVLVLHGWAAGILTGALIGLAAALGIAIWHNRDLLRLPSPCFDAKPLLRRLIPLTVGCGVSQFLFSADLIFVQSRFENTAPYVFGGTLARAIVIFTAPLVAVMFPKIVHSAVRQQENKLMLLTLGFTFLLASCAAFGLTLTAPLIIRLGSKPEYISFVPLIPWFAWSMVPLAVGNVLLNNLMAHSKFKCVPALLLVSIGYWVALKFFGISFQTVILTCGVFNTIFLLVTFLFTWLAMPESFVRTRLQPSPVIE